MTIFEVASPSICSSLPGYLSGILNSDVDWKLVVTVGIPSLLVVAGWLLVHHLTARRDLASKKREARIKAMEAAYMRIATAHNRKMSPEVTEKIETFVAEIQLYGTPRQIELVGEIVKGFVRRDPVVNYDAILIDLRDSIREELELESVTEMGTVWWLRLPVPAAPRRLRRSYRANASLTQ